MVGDCERVKKGRQQGKGHVLVFYPYILRETHVMTHPLNRNSSRNSQQLFSLPSHNTLAIQACKQPITYHPSNNISNHNDLRTQATRQTTDGKRPSSSSSSSGDSEQQQQQSQQQPLPVVAEIPLQPSQHGNVQHPTAC